MRLNILNLISPKITLALCLLLPFAKMEFCLYFEKKSGPAKTGAAGPIPLALCMYVCMYHKRGKIRWTKFSHFSRFSRVPRKFFREYKCFSLIILNNEYLWPRQHKNISAKTSMVLTPRIFSPVNLSLSIRMYACIN